MMAWASHPGQLASGRAILWQRDWLDLRQVWTDNSVASWDTAESRKP